MTQIGMTQPSSPAGTGSSPDARSLADARAWVAAGEDLCRTAIQGFDESDWAAPSGLPGWTRKHLGAHLAANADAVGNLIHWAATGEQTPMYSSPEQRNADIEAGAGKPGEALAAWFDRSAGALENAMDALTDEQWTHEVVTAQGRTVPASETPWMRARETCVHAVDLATGVTFSDLPAGFLAALAADIAAKRSAGAGPALVVTATDAGRSWTVAGDGNPVEVRGPLADVTAYLAGRDHAPLIGATGEPSPTIGPWL